MKKKSVCSVMLVVMLVVMLFVIVIFGSVPAYGEDVYFANVSLINERSLALGELCESYGRQDKSTDKYAAIRAGHVITEYQAAINAFRGEDGITDRDISSDVELLYLKGVSAGEVAYIYWSYEREISDAQHVREDYNGLLEKISEYNDVASLSGARKEINGKILVSVFSERISRLSSVDDSKEVVAITEEAVDRLTALLEDAVDESTFISFYEATAEQVDLQRKREYVMKEMSEIFDDVLGAGSLNDFAEKIFLRIEIAKNDSELNGILLDFITDILDSSFSGFDGKYANELKGDLIRECQLRAVTSSCQGKIFDASELFLDFYAQKSLALTRDELCEKIEVLSLGAKKQLAELGYLRDSDREVFWGRMVSARDSVYSCVADMDDIDGIKAKYLEFESAVKHIIFEAEREDLESAKAEIKETALKHSENIRGAIEALEYISNEDMQELLLKLDDALAKYTKLFSAAKSINELFELESQLEAESVSVESDARERDTKSMRSYFCETVANESKRGKDEIRKLSYLSDADKLEFFSALIEKAQGVSQAILAENDENAMLDEQEKFSLWVASVVERAVAVELDSAKMILRESAELKLHEVILSLNLLEFISSDERDALISELEISCDDLSDMLTLASTTSRAEILYNEFSLSTEALLSGATLENDRNARLYALAELDKIYSSCGRGEYSQEDFLEIERVYLRAKNDIEGAGAPKEYFAYLDQAALEIGAVKTLFELLKEELGTALLTEYKSFEAFGENYADCGGALLGIYTMARSRIETALPELGESGLRELFDRAVNEMRALPLEWVGDGDFSSKSSAFSEYPAGHDSTRRLYGCVVGSEGIPFGTSFLARRSEVTSEHRRAFRDAIKNLRITYFGEAAYTREELGEILSDMNVLGVIDARLTLDSVLFNEFTGEYTVRILLTDDLRSAIGVRVAYLSSTGDLEVFDSRREGNVLEFTTSHFSEFLILSQKDNGFLPFVIVTSLFAVLIGGGILLWWLKERRSTLACERVAPIALGDALLGVDHIASLPAHLDKVSALEASELICDVEAEKMLERSERKHEVCRGCKKTFINVDTLSDNFEAGSVITIERLKEKGLVPQSACYIKVLARGCVDKPLEVRAQAFSRDAVKMITLTGGRAVVEGTL